MDKWCIELAYSIGFTVSGIEANSKEEAIEKAKNMVNDAVVISDVGVDEGDFEFQQVTYVTTENNEK